MKMINKLFVAAAFAASFVFPACNGLEQPPTNQYTDANFWTAKNAETMVMTAYSQIYGAGTMWSDESLTDNLYNGYRIEDQTRIRRGIATSSLGLFSWNDLYTGIRSCHTFLGNSDRIQGLDEQKVARLTAECRFIRALLYFRLTNLYGDVPFFSEDLTLDEAMTIKRTPRAEVIASLTSDVESLIKDLPTVDNLPDTEKGRITQGAAAMLLARIALMDSNWEKVASWCQRIVDGEFGHYELFPSYEGLFKEENEYNCEVILDCGHVQGVRTWGEFKNMKPPTLRADYVTWVPTQSLVDSYLTLGGYTIDEEGTDFDRNNPYANRDPRMDATIIRDKSELYDPSTQTQHTIYINAASGQTADNVATTTAPGQYCTYTGYYTRKWFSPILNDNAYNSGLNIIIMRYADVLLMLAEAKNELGQMTASVWDSTIKPLRQRAGFTAEKALNMPSGDLRQVIRDERRVELALEGLRWWDIKRWKAGSEYLNGPVRGCTHVGGPAVLDTYSFDENRDYLWAVPLDEIDLNPNLKPQNTGYGR